MTTGMCQRRGFDPKGQSFRQNAIDGKSFVNGIYNTGCWLKGGGAGYWVRLCGPRYLGKGGGEHRSGCNHIETKLLPKDAADRTHRNEQVLSSAVGFVYSKHRAS